LLTFVDSSTSLSTPSPQVALCSSFMMRLSPRPRVTSVSSRLASTVSVSRAAASTVSFLTCVRHTHAHRSRLTPPLPVHASGRRLHRPQRHRRQIHLRFPLRRCVHGLPPSRLPTRQLTRFKKNTRRELHPQARYPWPALDGQCWPWHQRLAVLHHHRQDSLGTPLFFVFMHLRF
jgi:hypothetical protein